MAEQTVAQAAPTGLGCIEERPHHDVSLDSPSTTSYRRMRSTTTVYSHEVARM